MPLVVPVNVPPAAGMTVARLHAEPGRVVVVAVVVVVSLGVAAGSLDAALEPSLGADAVGADELDP